MVRISPALPEVVRGSSGDSRSDRRPGKRQRAAPLPTASDLWVSSLPGLRASRRGRDCVRPELTALYTASDARLSLFAGHLPSTAPHSSSDAHLYFLLARNKHIPKRERLVIWLNGGPGCSSFDGALIELGPVKVNKDQTLRVVESTAWNEYANVLFRACTFPCLGSPGCATCRSSRYARDNQAYARIHPQSTSQRGRGTPTCVPAALDRATSTLTRTDACRSRRTTTSENLPMRRIKLSSFSSTSTGSFRSSLPWTCVIKPSTRRVLCGSLNRES